MLGSALEPADFSVCMTHAQGAVHHVGPSSPSLRKVESGNANIQENLLATWQSRWPDWQCRQPVGKPCSQHLVGSAKEENMYSRNIWEEENLLHLHTQITPTQMHTSFLSSAPEVLSFFLRDTVML